MISVGMVAFLARSLNDIAKAPVEKAQENANFVIETSKSITKLVTDATGDGIGSQLLSKMSMKTFSQMHDGIRDIIEEYADMDFIDVGKFEALASGCGHIRTIVETLYSKDIQKNLATKKSQDNLLDAYEDLCEVLEDYADIDANNINQTTDNFIKFIDKVNGSDINNLKATADMFKQMAAFSKSISGDFEQLAETLNEKIATLLEKIQKGVDNMPEATDKDADKINNMSFDLASNEAKGQVSQNTVENMSDKIAAKQMQEKRDAALAKGGYNGTIEDIIAILTDEGVKIGRR